jgi:hypothetical protein
MVSLVSLWLAVLLSAVVVFVASSLLHMLLPWHKTDVAALPAEDDVLAALRRSGAAPGDYMFPWGGSMAAMKDPAFIAKLRQGPAGKMTIFPPMTGERPTMTPQLVQWFVFIVVVSIFAAYIASRALPPAADQWQVMRFAGTTAFAAYALGDVPTSIWWKQKWSTTIKTIIDGLIYALLTGAVFAWMWPAV